MNGKVEKKKLLRDKVLGGKEGQCEKEGIRKDLERKSEGKKRQKEKEKQRGKSKSKQTETRKMGVSETENKTKGKREKREGKIKERVREGMVK